MTLSKLPGHGAWPVRNKTQSSQKSTQIPLQPVRFRCTSPQAAPKTLRSSGTTSTLPRPFSCPSFSFRLKSSLWLVETWANVVDSPNSNTENQPKALHSPSSRATSNPTKSSPQSKAPSLELKPLKFFNMSSEASRLTFCRSLALFEASSVLRSPLVWFGLGFLFHGCFFPSGWKWGSLETASGSGRWDLALEKKKVIWGQRCIDIVTVITRVVLYHEVGSVKNLCSAIACWDGGWRKSLDEGEM